MVSLSPATATLGGRGPDGRATVRGVLVDGFALDRHEVTNGQYALCVRAGRCVRPSRELVNAGANEVWRGPRLVKMEVRVGQADLRGVNGGARAVTAVGQTAWEVGAGHCWVHGITLCRYRLNAAWHH